MAQFTSAFNGLWEHLHGMREVAEPAAGVLPARRTMKAMMLPALH